MNEVLLFIGSNIYTKLSVIKYVLIVCYVRHDTPQTEIPIRFRTLIIAIAETITTMPKQPTPPAINFSCFAVGRLSEFAIVFKLYIIVSSTTVFCLKIYDCITESILFTSSV